MILIKEGVLSDGFDEIFLWSLKSVGRVIIHEKIFVALYKQFHVGGRQSNGRGSGTL